MSEYYIVDLHMLTLSSARLII